MSARWAVALSCKMMAFFISSGHWTHKIEVLPYSQFHPVELDDEQEYLICHRPKQSSVLRATDFVQPCDFMMNVDDSIWRTAV